MAKKKYARQTQAKINVYIPQDGDFFEAGYEHCPDRKVWRYSQPLKRFCCQCGCHLQVPYDQLINPVSLN